MVYQYTSREHTNPRSERNSINVWSGLCRNRLLGPILFEGALTGQRYLEMLRGPILDFLDDYPLNELQQLWWQQDGAPAHNAGIVTDYLNTVFPGKWIGNRGVVLWPARSPDLAPHDFFLWGHLKDLVYKTPPNDINLLRQSLERTMDRVPGRIIQRAINKVPERIQMCIQQQGHLFEHLI